MSEWARDQYDAAMPPRERDLEASRAFGSAVRVARARRSMSRAEVAQAARIEALTLGRIERGEREPGLSVLIRLAAALGLRPWELIKAMEEERGR